VADLSKLFKLLKQYGSITMMSEMTPLKHSVIATMEDLKNIVTIPKSHIDALINHLSCLPSILQKIATKEIICGGFIEAGIIDNISYSVPNLAAIIKTTRQQISLEEEQNFIEQFPQLLKIFTTRSLDRQQDATAWTSNLP
jgi:hypothetical protein